MFRLCIRILRPGEETSGHTPPNDQRKTKTMTLPATTITALETVTIGQVLNFKREARDSLDLTVYRLCNQALTGSTGAMEFVATQIHAIETEIKEYAKQKASEEDQRSEMDAHAGFEDAALESVLHAAAFGMKW